MLLDVHRLLKFSQHKYFHMGLIPANTPDLFIEKRHKKVFFSSSNWGVKYYKIALLKKYSPSLVLLREATAACECLPISNDRGFPVQKLELKV